MSKTFTTFGCITIAFLLSLLIVGDLRSQDLTATITILDDEAATMVVRGRFEKSDRPNKKNLVFLREYGNITGLAERFTNVEVTGVAGKNNVLKRLIPGEYLAEDTIDGWSYKIDLTPGMAASSNAHVSWLGKDQGLIMLGDVLPQSFGTGPLSASVKVVLPSGWNAFTTGHARDDGNYDIADIENAVVFIAKDGVARKLNVPNVDIGLVVVGEWFFSDAEAVESVETIASNYKKLFGGGPTRGSQIVIARFPVEQAIGNWEGDTRGQNVTILSSDTHFKSQSIQRLSEQLRHEIFHLWMPNDVELTGRYDWFYEGFALYRSLKTGVATKQIRFDDFLNSISGALETVDRQTKQISLVEASGARWADANERIYARGMAVAFLTDLALLRRSKGKVSTSNLLRSVYENHRTPASPQDGNSAILKIFGEYRELDEVVRRYITGSERIDWSPEILAAGLESTLPIKRGGLKITTRPNGKQKEILKALGYNN